MQPESPQVDLRTALAAQQAVIGQLQQQLNGALEKLQQPTVDIRAREEHDRLVAQLQQLTLAVDQARAAGADVDTRVRALGGTKALSVAGLHIRPYLGAASDARVWLFHVEKCTAGKADLARIRAAEAALQGSAASWLMQREAAKLPSAQTWADWRALLIARFAPITEDRLRDEIRSLRQGDSSVQEYADTFLEKAQQLPDRSEQTNVFDFCSGLTVKLRNEVRARAPTTLADAIRMADQFDFAMRGGVRTGPSPVIAHSSAGGSPSSGMEIDAVERATDARVVELGRIVEQQARRIEELAALGKQPARRFEGECWYCHKSGHSQRNCYKRQQEGGAVLTRPPAGRPSKGPARPNGL
jgi:hypothetical protein